LVGIRKPRRKPVAVAAGVGAVAAAVDDQSSEEDEVEWFVGWRGSDFGEREPCEHPEASWEAHQRRREEDYEQEMEHAFQNWGGIGGTRVHLVDEMMDGSPLYDPRDPDPDWPISAPILISNNDFEPIDWSGESSERVPRTLRPTDNPG
jgi:hypothetical protein